jgi:uroporphyrinogen decarboxylase|tara:strand:+ start:1111 stop:2295 length:1185 start_codon:yes stop_codon:yes gene_type:complete
MSTARASTLADVADARARDVVRRARAQKPLAASRRPRAVRRAPCARASSGDVDPLMLRAIRGEDVERPPIWMMRQAGRYMKVYQDLCKKHTTFRERSETVDLAVEISLQPYEAFKPDGVILFSDILTPLQGMNIPFDIVKGTGPIIFNPVREMDDIKSITPLEPEKSVPFVGESLKVLRNEIGNEATLLGFCGAPFTLASYIVEGGTSSHYKVIKKMAFDSPAVYEALMNKLTDAVIEYTRYQADSGAQVVQIFDSWASEFSPADFEVYCLPYLQRIVAECKQTHPHVPLILYSSGSAGFLERLATTNADVISLDGTIDMADARARLGMDQAVQGNMDPLHLFASQDFITKKVHETIAKAGNKKHVMNLGHGVMVGTPEENVGHFFKTVRDFRY